MDSPALAAEKALAVKSQAIEEMCDKSGQNLPSPSFALSTNFLFGQHTLVSAASPFSAADGRISIEVDSPISTRSAEMPIAPSNCANVAAATGSEITGLGNSAELTGESMPHADCSLSLQAHTTAASSPYSHSLNRSAAATAMSSRGAVFSPKAPPPRQFQPRQSISSIDHECMVPSGGNVTAAAAAPNIYSTDMASTPAVKISVQTTSAQSEPQAMGICQNAHSLAFSRSDIVGLPIMRPLEESSSLHANVDSDVPLQEKTSISVPAAKARRAPPPPTRQLSTSKLIPAEESNSGSTEPRKLPPPPPPRSESLRPRIPMTNIGVPDQSIDSVRAAAALVTAAVAVDSVQTHVAHT